MGSSADNSAVAASDNAQMNCPQCGDSDKLAVVQIAQVLTPMSAVSKGDLGEAELLEETLSPVGLLCRCCSWPYINASWRSQLPELDI